MVTKRAGTSGESRKLFALSEDNVRLTITEAYWAQYVPSLQGSSLFLFIV